MVIGLITYKNVNGFDERQLMLMKAFLQGAVYCWCKNRKNEWFAARDLLGGDNYYWQGPPLLALFEHYRAGREDQDSIQYAIEEAGKATGRLLKEVLINDKRTFETQSGYACTYRWTGEEEIGYFGALAIYR